MSKENNVIKIGILILIIVTIYLLVVQNPENFSTNSMYSGQMENPYLEPLSYQIVPNNQIQSGMSNNQMQSGTGNSNLFYIPNIPNQSNDPYSTLYQQPLLYPTEMYPKVPWYPKAGYPCVEGQCGATGTCYNGTCLPNSSLNTVMNVPIN